MKKRIGYFLFNYASGYLRGWADDLESPGLRWTLEKTP
jgi:hypothetical protein